MSILESENIKMLLLFSVVSVSICAVQILLRRKVNFLPICKVTIVLPLVYIITRALKDIGGALWAVTVANDIAPSVWNQGISRILVSSSDALWVTVFLSLVYSLTATVLKNQKH